MGTLQHVMHTGARPIGIPEFMDAMRATCTPRIPQARATIHRRVGVAVSGGADSMALAFLCSQIRKHEGDFKIADNPVSGFRGWVVDHRLREGSEKEALAVCRTLRDMGFIAELLTLDWSKVLGDYNHPKDLPNVESVARTLRYQKLGYQCSIRKTASLLMAHHEDDQYETVLMRLLQGHGSRGLRGMRSAHAIPECEGIFGADGSGFVDDQKSRFPFYNLTPSKKDRKALRRELKGRVRSFLDGTDSSDGDVELTGADLGSADVKNVRQSKRSLSQETAAIDVEDGGVTVYRPLLEFGKDRLIATCLENKVPWWEDATNDDPTLTMRNAVRRLYKGFTLPKALQKPAILALSKRCERRIQAQEAEADRLLSQTVIHSFEPLAGTVTVQFPELARCLSVRDSRSPQRRQARLQKRREVAAILLRRILMLVTPESQPPLLAMLENHVSRLFPSLALPDEEAATAGPPKAFSLSGVHLVPLKSKPSSSDTALSSGSATNDPRQQSHAQPIWFLSRAPYMSTRPLPVFHTSEQARRRRRRVGWAAKPATWGLPWTAMWALWDGRYWVRAEHRLRCRVVVQPLLREHAREFRARLPPPDRARLAAALAAFAPAKVRYSVPAIYIDEPVDVARGWHRLARPPIPRPPIPVYSDAATPTATTAPIVQDGSVDANAPRLMLVALPTLDIRLPHLEDWMAYEIRYRKVDRHTLSTAGSFSRGSFVAPRTVVTRRVTRGRRGQGRVR
ncbi:adenine nucleotide alpha hydrolases-like protein [Hypoxylon sp. FL1284]|nr:adenine nucleotide alpha hydrolases-like protein [Hypoxylon sp. FL1284]